MRSRRDPCFQGRKAGPEVDKEAISRKVKLQRDRDVGEMDTERLQRDEWNRALQNTKALLVSVPQR